MKAWLRLTDPIEDIMGPAIVWYEHPVVQGAVGAIVGGGLPMMLGASSHGVELGAGVGMISLPVLYWQGKNLYEYMATSPICQGVVNSISRIV